MPRRGSGSETRVRSEPRAGGTGAGCCIRLAPSKACLNMRFQRRETRGELLGSRRESAAAETAAKIAKTGSGELKFSLQSFHLFSCSHLSFSLLVAVPPPLPRPPAPDSGEPISPRSCFLFATVDWASPRKWPPPFIKGLFIWTTWLFCPNPEITFGRGEKRPCIGAPSRRRRPPNGSQRWIFRTLQEAIISGCSSDFGIPVRAHVSAALPLHPVAGVKRSPSPQHQIRGGTFLGKYCSVSSPPRPPAPPPRQSGNNVIGSLLALC